MQAQPLPDITGALAGVNPLDCNSVTNFCDQFNLNCTSQYFPRSCGSSTTTTDPTFIIPQVVRVDKEPEFLADMQEQQRIA